jgi:Alkylmercury lyase
MFSQAVEVTSRDPRTGETFRAQVGPDGNATWEPASAAVVTGAFDRSGDSCHGCCPVLNFFATRASAERWLTEHAHARGHVISIEDAIAAGRAVFGDVFDGR